MKYALVTFGCRVNQADSLTIEDGLRARGAIAAPPDEAQLVVVNTCSVTASADQAARQTIRQITRRNPEARIVVTGCYATRRPDEVASLPNVIRVVPNTEKDLLVCEFFGDGDGPCGTTLSPGVAGRTALTLRVQTGCEEQCSYCIIPQTRGASRSRSMAQIRRQIDQAIDSGYKEIAITGVHLGSYGRDSGDGASLLSLVRLLAAWQADVRFRISSLEPMDCSPELVGEFASSPRLAPHFHLPLQHGSNRILRAMQRPYTVEYYEGLVGSIRTRLPHAAIGSDIIVGFPGETADDFDEMCGVLERLPLTHLHVFPYSDRPGTLASHMKSKVDGREIRARAAAVRAIGERKARAFRQSQVGQRHRGLTVDDGRSVVTGNYLKLRLEEQRPRNEWIDVRATGEYSASVAGDLKVSTTA